jgi:hypothetical protein
MTWRRKVDRNHAEIRDGLRDLGFDVWDCSRFGEGFPDLLVFAHGRLFLLEVKMPGEHLTLAQEFFRTSFPVVIVHSLEEAIGAASNARLP